MAVSVNDNAMTTITTTTVTRTEEIVMTATRKIVTVVKASMEATKISRTVAIIVNKILTVTSTTVEAIGMAMEAKANDKEEVVVMEAATEVDKETKWNVKEAVTSMEVAVVVASLENNMATEEAIATLTTDQEVETLVVEAMAVITTMTVAVATMIEELVVEAVATTTVKTKATDSRAQVAVAEVVKASDSKIASEVAKTEMQVEVALTALRLVIHKNHSRSATSPALTLTTTKKAGAIKSQTSLKRQESSATNFRSLLTLSLPLVKTRSQLSTSRSLLSLDKIQPCNLRVNSITCSSATNLFR